jgi:2-haloacid dehalogenase
MNPEQYIPFDEVCTKALCHALGRKGINDETDEDLKEMEAAYNCLKTFPEVHGFFDSLSKTKVDSYIFSNGTIDMLAHLIEVNPSLHPTFLTPGQEKLVSVDQRVRKYKPHPDVYKDFVRYVGRTGSESSVVLVSSNSFDIVGAKNCGWTTIWVDRKQTGWVDRLASKPNYVIHDVGEVLWILDELKKKNACK